MLICDRCRRERSIEGGRFAQNARHLLGRAAVRTFSVGGCSFCPVRWYCRDCCEGLLRLRARGLL